MRKDGWLSEESVKVGTPLSLLTEDTNIRNNSHMQSGILFEYIQILSLLGMTLPGRSFPNDFSGGVIKTRHGHLGYSQSDSVGTLEIVSSNQTKNA